MEPTAPIPVLRSRARTMFETVRGYKKTTLITAVAACFVFAFYYLTIRPPREFPAGAVIHVREGDSLSKIALKLKEDNIVKSSMWFTNLAILLGREKSVVAGDYYFHEPNNLFEVAERVMSGEFRLSPLKITIPEGSNVYEIADIVKKQVSTFDDGEFLRIASDKEGYLFPDTYFIMPNATPANIVDVMNENYALKIKQAYPFLYQFGKTERDVIIMASILEGEARQTETRRIIAGILWKRLEEGMLLQVDTTFKYINGKPSETLTRDDLKIDSPYNTYKYKGLPVGPVSNPGLDTIIAAVTPVSTPYYYFLTDREGNMHYAKTLKEHQANVNRYLDND